MATAPAPSLLDAGTHAARWIAEYRARATSGDVLCAQPDPAWSGMFEELAAIAGDDLGQARDRVQRHAEDIGTGFRIIGESEERPWPLSPVPLYQLVPLYVSGWPSAFGSLIERNAGRTLSMSSPISQVALFGAL